MAAPTSPRPMPADASSPIYDVAVIGAGVVGAAIARALAHYRLRVVLLEAGADIGAGTSKANTAILHTGFDAKPGTLEACLVRRGQALLSAYGPAAGIPIERLGALLVAWDAEQLAALPGIAENARANGYTAASPVAVEEVYRLEPQLGPGALGALAIPDESIVCPFTTPLAFATEAVMNGVSLVLDAPLQAVAPAPATPVRALAAAMQVPAAAAAALATADTLHRLTTPRGVFHAQHVVNAAGLDADVIDRLFGHETFTVTPRRGELIVFDKSARPLVSHVLLPVPTKLTKGVLVSPTVFGNVVLGPTAEDIWDKRATDSTAAGLRSLMEKGRRIMPALAEEEVTAVYAGLRAATEHADYQIAFYPGERYVCVGGIRSTGLTASMAIAEHVVEGLREAGLALDLREEFKPVRMPNIGESFPRPYQCPEMIAANPDYGTIVCHCERVSRGEILDAAAAVIPARSVDGLRRRTRALLGRCQGFYCAPQVARLLAEASGQTVVAILGVDVGVYGDVGKAAQ
jgi:glycerol-3-phosphate dehydrogenase